MLFQSDNYLRPEVIYGSWPPVTSIKLGGRTVQSDRAVSVKIKLLNPEEDQLYWCAKKQHCDRVNLGIFHRDFGDVEVAYSFSSPQTHIFLSGYSIHFETFENLSFSSYNATIRVRPEHVFQPENFLNRHHSEYDKINHLSSLTQERLTDCNRPYLKALMESGQGSPQDFGGSLRKTLVASHLNALRRKEDTIIPSPKSLHQQKKFPLYSCQIPLIREGLSNRETLDYQYTSQHFNDCERDFNFHEEFNIGMGITSKSSPVSTPPVFPPLRPYEFPEMVYSATSIQGGIHPTQILKLVKQRQDLTQHKISEKERRNLAATCCPSDVSDTDTGGYDDQKSDEHFPSKHFKKKSTREHRLRKARSLIMMLCIWMYILSLSSGRYSQSLC